MSHIVYVEGHILIKTPYFKYFNAGCYFSEPPQGAEIITPNDEINGEKVLIITDEKAPSFFKEYYAKGEFTQYWDWAPFFSRTIDDCFSSFDSKIEEVIDLIAHNDTHVHTRQNLYRLSIVSTVAALDTLISDLILFISTKDKDCFLKIIGHLGLSANSLFKLMKRIIHMWCDCAIDSAEQDVIALILRKSYSSLKEIQTILKDLYGITIPKDVTVEEIITLRHIIAHRNGRRKDDTVLEFSKDELLSNITQIKDFAYSIKTLISDSRPPTLI